MFITLYHRIKIHVIKNNFQIEDTAKKRVFKNVLSLFLLQVSNYLLPLLTLPYLVRILGPEKFGLIAFVQSFIQYFVVFTDYGFNLSATREISIHRENIHKLSEIFSSVIIIKIFLTIISAFILTAAVLTFSQFRDNYLLCFITFGTVIGNCLFPIWFFQGMEKMKYITYLNILVKLFYTLCIFIFIDHSSDYIFVPLIYSLCSFLIGLLSIWIVIKYFKINFFFTNYSIIKRQINEGWYIFLSTVTISLYTISNTFILGLFSNQIFVGYYSAGEKLIRSLQSLFTPLTQSIYPYINHLLTKSKDNGILFIRKITIYIGFFSLMISLLIFIYADFLSNIILGSQYQESITVIKILSPLPFVISLSNIFGIQVMIPFNFKKAFMTILIFASIVNIILSIILIPKYYHVGISFSVLATEIIVTTIMFVYLHLKGIYIFGVKK